MKRLLLAALLCAVPLEAQQIGAAYRLDTLAVRLDGGAGGVNYSTMPAPTGCASGYVPYFDASLKMACSPTVYAPATNTTTVGTLAARNVTATALPASGSITVTPTGTTGATTYTYSLQACLADGTCNAAGAASTTAAGHATLSASNFNRLSWSAVAGAASYKVRRDVGGASTGVIWSGTGLAVDDTGLVGDGTVKPVAPMTGTVQAANYKTDANGNVASGGDALRSNTSGTYNTANGYDALRSNTSGTYNTANGYGALYLNTTGNYNDATGYYTLGSNTTGSNNSASGAYTLTSNTTGSYNSATGYTVLVSNTSGSGNSATGYAALHSNTSGSYNSAIGYESGYNTGAAASIANAATTSTNVTFLGYRAGLGSPTQRTNATALGAGAYVDADNTVVLGNAAVTDVLAGSTGQARLVGRGVRLTSGTRPTCDASARGLIWYVAGGAGVADTCEVCVKSALDAYAWVSLF